MTPLVLPFPYCVIVHNVQFHFWEMQPDVQLHIYFLFIGKTFFHIEKPLLHPLQVWKFSVTHPTMEGGLIQHFADVKPPFQQWRSKGGTGRAVRPGQQELWGRRSPPHPCSYQRPLRGGKGRHRQYPLSLAFTCGCRGLQTQRSPRAAKRLATPRPSKGGKRLVTAKNSVCGQSQTFNATHTLRCPHALLQGVYYSRLIWNCGRVLHSSKVNYACLECFCEFLTSVNEVPFGHEHKFFS